MPSWRRESRAPRDLGNGDQLALSKPQNFHGPRLPGFGGLTLRGAWMGERQLEVQGPREGPETWSNAAQNSPDFASSYAVDERFEWLRQAAHLDCGA